MLPVSALKVIHVLLSNQRSLFLRELAREAEVPLSVCSRHVNELKRLGYVRKRPRIRVTNQELVYLMVYWHPLKSLEL